jgi:hypothetical protein
VSIYYTPNSVLGTGSILVNTTTNLEAQPLRSFPFKWMRETTNKIKIKYRVVRHSTPVKSKHGTGI